MPTITLHHCVAVHVYGPVPPANVNLQVSTGGRAGDGKVEVSSPQLPVPVDVPTGTNPPQTVPIPLCTDITLHYHRDEGGPDTVDVTWDV